MTDGDREALGRMAYAIFSEVGDHHLAWDEMSVVRREVFRRMAEQIYNQGRMYERTNHGEAE